MTHSRYKRVALLQKRNISKCGKYKAPYAPKKLTIYPALLQRRFFVI